MHGSVRYESGLGYYIFNQLMNLVLLGTGGYLIYLMGGVMWGILMHQGNSMWEFNAIRDMAANELTPKAISRAQKRAREWMKNKSRQNTQD